MRLTISAWLCLFTAALISGCQPGMEKSCSLCSTTYQPLVSATELDDLSENEIKEKYPAGFSVDKNRSSAELVEKLQRLEKVGLKITNSSATANELRTITQEVLKAGSAKEYFDQVSGSGGKGLDNYMHNELLPYGFRKLQNIDKKGLESLSPKVIAYTYQKSHYWENIGYADEQNAPNKVKDWLKQQANSITSHINTMTHVSQLNLSNGQIEQISYLMALEYLSEAVKGLYYFRKKAPLTFYRQLAIKSMGVDPSQPSQ